MVHCRVDLRWWYLQVFRFSPNSEKLLKKPQNSPLASSSYFPAIPTMAQQFHKSIELINLTVTVYMVLQGVGMFYTCIFRHRETILTSLAGPMVWGPICDRWGRRLVFLACLLILALSCVGLALTPTNAYWLLLLLRCVQAFGSASTIAVGKSPHSTARCDSY